MKDKLGMISAIVAAVDFCLMEVFRGIASTYIRMHLPLGANIAAFWLMVLSYAACALVIVCNGVSLIMRYSWRRLTVAVISVVIPLAILLLPYTGPYSSLNCRVNASLRAETVEALKEGALEHCKIGEQVYFIADPSISYTGTVLYDGDKALFYLYKGMSADVVLIYSPRDEAPSPSDFQVGLPSGYAYDIEPIKRVSDSYWLAYKK